MVEKLIKEFLDFGKVKKLFTYDWKKVFNNIIPKGDKKTIKKEESSLIIDGAYMIAVGAILAKVCDVIITIITSSNVNGIFNSAAFSLAIRVGIGALVVGLLLSLIFPAVVFAYNKITDKKEQSTWFYFIIAILCALGLIIVFANVINYLLNIGLTPICSIIGLASSFISFMGLVYLFDGTVDFCIRDVKEEKKEEVKTSEKKESKEEKKSSSKFCSECGAPVIGKFCNKCGSRIK